MSIPQLKIGQRLTLGFASVLALLAVMAAVAWNGLESSNAATQRIERMERRAAINAWFGDDLEPQRIDLCCAPAAGRYSV